MSRNAHWANSAVAETALGIRFLVAAYRLGGRWLAAVLMLPVIAFYFVTTRRARRASNQFLRHVARVQGWRRQPGLRHSFWHFWSFGLSLIDKFAAWLDQIKPERVTIENPELLDRLIGRGQGGLLFITHLGNFEVCRALSRSHPIKLTVIHHTKSTATFNRLLAQFANDATVELLQVSEFTAATAMRLSDKLARGEFVAIAGDRIPIDNPEATLSVPFLGEPAPFPTGPFTLATALEAPALLLVCLREGGRFRVVFESLSEGGKVPRHERRQAIAALTRAYVAKLEHYVLQAPYQWFNFYDYWAAPALQGRGATQAKSAPGQHKGTKTPS